MSGELSAREDKKAKANAKPKTVETDNEAEMSSANAKKVVKPFDDDSIGGAKDIESEPEDGFDDAPEDH